MIHQNHSSRNCKPMKKFTFGFLVLTAGALLLLFNVGVIPGEYRHIVFSWQMLLIAAGIINVVSRDGRMLGYILLAIGGFFIIPEFYSFDYNFVNLFWPALLIFVGLLILTYGGRSRKFHMRKNDLKLEEGYIYETNIFGGSKQRLDAQTFKGGEIVNIFGGSEVDLTQLDLGEGRNVLDISCVFGGVKLLVPADWKVKLQVSSVLGGVSDKRPATKRSAEDQNELVITGVAVFGGAEIASY